jgi:hypothetical protein
MLTSAVLIILSLGLVAAGMPLDSKTRSNDRTQAPNAPTKVSLSSFAAFISDDGDVSILWRSGHELDNLGYNIYRERDNQRVQLNPSIIAGSIFQAGQGIELRAGFSYAWRDKVARFGPVRGVRYWLESVDVEGKSVWYGPVTLQPGAFRPVTSSKLLSDYSVESPRTKQAEWTGSSSIRPNEDTSVFNKPAVAGAGTDSPEQDQQWILASQVAVKLLVDREGWQRVTRLELVTAGLDQHTPLANLQLFEGGVEQAIRVNADGSVEFFGRPLLTSANDKRVYWLISGATPGKRVIATSAGPFDTNVPAGSFPSTIERRDRSVYFASLLNGLGDNYYGPSISASGMNQTLQVTALDQSSPTAGAMLEVGVQGLTLQAHLVRVQLNGVLLGQISLNSRERSDAQFPITVAQLRDNKNSITLTSIAGGADVSLIDYVRVSYPRRYEATGNRLSFSVPGGQAVKVSGFATSALRVLDVTDPVNVSELTVSPQSEPSGFAFTLPSVASARKLTALPTSGNFDHPQELRRNEPSTWHLTSNAADMLMVTHGIFRQSLAPLQALRESQGLQVAMIDVEDLYDEFSFGAHTPQAIRAFVERAKTMWQTGPNYLLLVGDGTADPRDYFGIGSKDFVPALMVDSNFSESPSDDAFVDFNDDGLPELAVGRLPATTSQDTTVLVNKILNYEMGVPGDTLQRGAVMVSDLFDGSYDFEAFSLDVRTSLPPTMAVQYINRSAGDTATIRGQIQTAVNLGPGVVNYLGHGSVGVWTGAGLLTVTDPPNFNNSQRLSIFVMMTCLNGAFTEVNGESLAESILKAPNGGAVAVWASSGLTIPYGQVSVSKQFYTLLFSGQTPRIGDATRQAKASTNDMDVRRLSILFGDPAMRFR